MVSKIKDFIFVCFGKNFLSVFFFFVFVVFKFSVFKFELIKSANINKVCVYVRSKKKDDSAKSVCERERKRDWRGGEHKKGDLHTSCHALISKFGKLLKQAN